MEALTCHIAWEETREQLYGVNSLFICICVPGIDSGHQVFVTSAFATNPFCQPHTSELCPSNSKSLLMWLELLTFIFYFCVF